MQKTLPLNCVSVAKSVTSTLGVSASGSQEAAGAIHTDLQKGFIRAEVVTYTDLTTLGGLTEAKTHGKLRLEGKEYIVQDGDILNIRFNI